MLLREVKAAVRRSTGKHLWMEPKNRLEGRVVQIYKVKAVNNLSEMPKGPTGYDSFVNLHTSSYNWCAGDTVISEGVQDADSTEAVGNS